jgi:hypothetical protein
MSPASDVTDEPHHNSKLLLICAHHGRQLTREVIVAVLKIGVWPWLILAAVLIVVGVE